MRRNAVNYSTSEDGERPFWISYSDLMTALMVLFLVVMVTSLSTISQKIISESSGAEGENKNLSVNDQLLDRQLADQKFDGAVVSEAVSNRLNEIGELCNKLKNNLTIIELGGNVDCSKNIIELGEAGQFDSNSYKLSESGKKKLLELVPELISVAYSDLGVKWLKKIHIQGFTDSVGSYLYNLNLSMKRSEWVMCQIIQKDPKNKGEFSLSDYERQKAKEIFLVGGVSFNDQRGNKGESRRIEFKLDYYGLGESENRKNKALIKKGLTAERCQL